MGWKSEKLGFDSEQKKENFLFTITSRRALGPTQPSTQWASGIVSPGVKRKGREPGHFPTSSATVEIAGAIPPLPQMSSRLGN
jgi:hypothetical protein